VKKSKGTSSCPVLPVASKILACYENEYTRGGNLSVCIGE